MNTAIWPSRFGSAFAAFSTLGRRAGSFFTSVAPGTSTTALGAAGFSVAFGSSTVAALGAPFLTSVLASAAFSAGFAASLGSLALISPVTISDGCASTGLSSVAATSRRSAESGSASDFVISGLTSAEFASGLASGLEASDVLTGSASFVAVAVDPDGAASDIVGALDVDGIELLASAVRV